MNLKLKTKVKVAVKAGALGLLLICGWTTNMGYKYFNNNDIQVGNQAYDSEILTAVPSMHNAALISMDTETYHESDLVSSPNSAAHGRRLDSGLYPPDFLTTRQRAAGGWVIHAFLVVYMFFGLAIVCDEYFVPALDVIIEKIGMSEDVAGATFMAAGGSAPELFTSFVGVFAEGTGGGSDVGFGTIVGSAVFNVLFVIAMCAIFSKDTLTLTWWPLARDSSYYAISLLVLTFCFRDRVIEVWEAALLFGMYFGYVVLMANNVGIKKAVYGILKLELKDESGEDGPCAIPIDADFRIGVMAILMAKVDAKGKGYALDKDKRLFRAAKIVMAKKKLEKKNSVKQVIPGAENGKSDKPDATDEGFSTVIVAIDPEVEEEDTETTEVTMLRESTETAVTEPKGSTEPAEAETVEKAGPEEEEMEPKTMAIPKGALPKFFYFFLFPLTFSLYLTCPDMAVKPKRWPIAFLASIVWIGIYSYFMVWWTSMIGETLGVPITVMGLTFLAAGTSIPDLLTSVIVARQGFGDMAVSSSIGSNIFDILVGLPVPWLFWLIINGESGISVGSDGLFTSVVTLLVMLALVIISIAVCKWKLSRPLAGVMFVLYGCFVAQSLYLELR